MPVPEGRGLRRAGVFEGEGEADAAAGGLGAQYARVLQAGSAAASGGCTDAGVRLGALLSVRAPAGRLCPHPAFRSCLAQRLSTAPCWAGGSSPAVILKILYAHVRAHCPGRDRVRLEPQPLPYQCTRTGRPATCAARSADARARASRAQALAAAPPAAVESRAADWAPLFLAYAASRRGPTTADHHASAPDDDPDDDGGVGAASRVGGKCGPRQSDLPV